ncbi:MAG: AGE family epimerase/isomerase [Planctomycetota bacterium]
MPRSREDFREYLCDYFMPRWVQHGQEENGAFLYFLHHDWSPGDNPDRRLRVQARQIWSCRKTGQNEAAERGFAYLLDRFHDEKHGGFFLTVTPDGEPLDRSKELYEHAFVLLACAAMNTSQSKEVALEVIECLERRLMDGTHGGFFEGGSESWEPRLGPRRQNPHMHLLEALLAWAEADPKGQWGDRAQAMLDLFYNHFYDVQRDILREHFTEDWKPAPGDPGEVVEPGHHFEWVFLLEEYARLFDQAQWCDATCGLWDWGRAHGRDPNGGVYNECRRDGSPTNRRKRVWPQTEFLRAVGIRYRDSLESRWHEEVESHLDWLRAHYCAEIFPGWKEELDENNTIITQEQRATTVYHIVAAFLVLMDAV